MPEATEARVAALAPAVPRGDEDGWEAVLRDLLRVCHDALRPDAAGGRAIEAQPPPEGAS